MINLKEIRDKGVRNEEKELLGLLGLIAAMVLVFTHIAQAKDEEVTFIDPAVKLDELGRFQAFESLEGGILLVDTKTERTWLYHLGNWHINPFIKGQSFPGDGKYAIMSSEKKETEK